MSTEVEFLSAYHSIKASSKEAMEQIDVAISFEEHQHPLDAVAAYTLALEIIENTFSIPVGLPDNIDAVEREWQDACLIIQKMKGAKDDISYRLKVLKANNTQIDSAAVADELVDVDADKEEPAAKQKKSILAENPTTYFDIENAIGTSKTYREIITALRHVIAIKNSGVQFDILFHSKAKLYKVHINGEVAALAGETSLSVIMCTVENQAKAHNWRFLNGICFLQCAIPAASSSSTSDGAGAASTPEDADPNTMFWVYPLVPSVTTCYRTEYGAFILPDMEAHITGNAFGIMFAKHKMTKTEKSEEEEEQLTDLEQFFLDLLEAVLAGRVELLQQPLVREQRDTSQVISKHIVGAADFVSRNLIKGAEKTGEFMMKNTPYIIGKLQPAPADATPVPSPVQTTVAVAKNVTHVAADITGWVADKVGTASRAVGRFLAPHIQSGGSTLLQKTFGYDSDEANSKMEGAFIIAAGAAEGIGTVYDGLETSAKILGTNLSQNSVKIIEHKYGPSAGDVAAGTFDTIGNTFNVSQNVNYFTPKGIATKVVKNTGKAVVIDYKSNKNIVPAGLLYPDLRALKDKQE